MTFLASKIRRPVGRAPARVQACAPGQGDIYAALDLGTNNCRMLVARPARRGFRVIDAFSRATRLGEGLAVTGALSDAAMLRTIDALKMCGEKMMRNGVTRARYVATEACRRATNCDSFLSMVARETGLAIEIISPQEEARLALAGCAPLLDRDMPHALVFDIGGGSTELIWVRTERGRPEQILGFASLPLGVVTLTEHRGADLGSAAGYRAVVADVARLLEPFDSRHGISAGIAAGGAQMLGTSGTVTTLGGIVLDLPRYDRQVVDGHVLEFSDIEAVSHRLAAMTHGQRVSHPCIGRERADLVVAGCAILEAICKTWPLGRLRVADRGVREGVLLSMMRADTKAAAQ